MQAAQCDFKRVTAAGLKPMPSPGGAPDEEEEGELSALMAKLHAAKPPEEVMKVFCLHLMRPSMYHENMELSVVA